jgi:hypothetical protein
VHPQEYPLSASRCTNVSCSGHRALDPLARKALLACMLVLAVVQFIYGREAITALGTSRRESSVNEAATSITFN